MKTNTLLVLLTAILFIACNPDDDMISCEEFIDNGMVNPISAEGQLNASFWDLSTDLIFVNDNQDSLIFETQNKFVFGNDAIIKTNCENGDSTSNIYELNSITKSFLNPEYSLSIFANSRFAFETVDQGDGTFVSRQVNCLIQTLTASFRSSGSTNSIFITQNFNPDSCSDIVLSISNFTLENSLELNGKTFDNVLVSDDIIFGNPSNFKLYFSNELGFLAFEDEAEVLWVISD